MAIAPIELTQEEKIVLQQFVKNGNHNAHIITRARVILLMDRSGKKDHARPGRAAEACGISRQAVYDIMKDFRNAETMDAFLQRKPNKNKNVPKKITGKVEAYVTEIACSEPPEGHARWTVRLIAERVVQLNIVDSLSKSSVADILKKANISLT